MGESFYVFFNKNINIEFQIIYKSHTYFRTRIVFRFWKKKGI